MKKSFIKRYFINKYGILVAVLLVVAAYFLFFRDQKTSNLEYATAEVGTIIERVSVTGKISPVEKADLAFEKGGVVRKINFVVGQTVKKGDIIAMLDSAGDEAALASAKAKLADLSRGLNTQELASEQAKVASAEVTLASAKQDALNASRSAYVLAQGAVVKYADILFSNPQSANPTILIRTRSSVEQIAIGVARTSVTEALMQWGNDINSSGQAESDPAAKITRANQYLAVIKSFMNDLSAIVNDLNPFNSGLSQTVIDADVASVNSGMSALNQAIDAVTAAKTALESAIAALDQAKSNFDLKNAGSSIQSVAAQSAIVDQYRAELAKDKIVSPIDGIVTKAEPRLGEFVSPGTNTFSVMSDGEFKIEAYVPEADIAKVSLGNLASTTLDAYGSTIDFPTVVTAIDPAENILEGVPTYKVTLKFVNEDDRIRSGMTANLEIATATREGVVKIPNRAVFDNEGVRSVRILKADNVNYDIVPVTVGLRGYDGQIEIVNGLSAGERVVTYIK